ncbi:MAG TPA: hypothetical protein VGZ29_16855 [Terriglobia bacterium]|nr:hypothetical protein [Terriglobia bacterium]
MRLDAERLQNPVDHPLLAIDRLAQRLPVAEHALLLRGVDLEPGHAGTLRHRFLVLPEPVSEPGVLELARNEIMQTFDRFPGGAGFSGKKVLPPIADGLAAIVLALQIPAVQVFHHAVRVAINLAPVELGVEEHQGLDDRLVFGDRVFHPVQALRLPADAGQIAGDFLKTTGHFESRSAGRGTRDKRRGCVPKPRDSRCSRARSWKCSASMGGTGSYGVINRS